MKFVVSCLLICVTLGGCASSPKPQTQMPSLMGQPLPVSPAWWRFANQACQGPVNILLDSPESIDFGDGPDQIYSSYLSDIGTLLSVDGIADYENSAGVKMRAAYFVRWYNPAYTLDPDTVWLFKASSITKLGPVAPPETRPSDTMPAEIRPAVEP